MHFKETARTTKETREDTRARETRDDNQADVGFVVVQLSLSRSLSASRVLCLSLSVFFSPYRSLFSLCLSR